MSGGRKNSNLRAALVAGALGLSATVTGCNTAGNGTDGSLDLSSAPGKEQHNIRIVPHLPAPLDTAGGTEQPIAKNDVLQVEVFQVKDLNREVQVDSLGNISLPLIGDTRAAGKTVRALERDIEKLYGARYLRSPDVKVFVKKSFGQRVTVDGEVGKAGLHDVTATSSLISAISQAGGLKQIADPTKVYVFRDHGDERLVAKYNVSRIRSGKHPDPQIYGGDVIVVFRSATRVAMRNLREALGIARAASVLVP